MKEKIINKVININGHKHLLVSHTKNRIRIIKNRDKKVVIDELGFFVPGFLLSVNESIKYAEFV